MWAAPNPDADPRYRWVIVAAAATMLAISMGQIVNGLSPFFDPLETEFARSRADVVLVNTFGLLGLAFGGLLMGVLADCVPVRRMALLGAITTGLCALAAARVQSLPMLYLLSFLAGAFGGGALFAPLFALVGSWFRTGAGLAIGLVSAGQALGQGCIPLINTFMIEWLGWRMAMTLNGLASILLLVPLALLLKEAPQPAVRNPAPAAPAEGYSVGFILICIAVLLCCSLMSVPLVHLLPLIEGCGIPAPDAAGAVLAMMISAICGRVAFGALADRLGAVLAYLGASAWQTALVLGFPMLGSLPEFQAFAPIYGFGYGGVMTCVMATVRLVAPKGRLASATGLAMAFAWVGHGLGGYMAGMLFNLTLDYDLAFQVSAIAGALNLLLLVQLVRTTV